MHTPLKAATWSQVLVAHPDKAFARYLLAGITEGFRIGFRYRSPLTSSSANMASAIQHPEVFEEYLSKELSLGCMLGPFPSSMNLPYLQVNRVGIIPKGHNTGKWRLITDLSFPLNQSVNDGIDPSLCFLSYITIEDVAAVVAHLGVGTLLVKVDIESTYRLVPYLARWEGEGRNGKALERWARRDTIHSMGLWQARCLLQGGNSLGKYKLYFRNYNIPP